MTRNRIRARVIRGKLTHSTQRRVGPLARASRSDTVSGMYEPLLSRTRELASAFLDTIDTRPVNARATFDQLMSALDGPVPDGPHDPLAVIEQLAQAAEPGLVASTGP